MRIAAERVTSSRGEAARGEAPRREAPEAGPSRRRSGSSGQRRTRVRKVHRIVRHLEPWSVLKLSILFYLVLFLIICVASAVLWGVGRTTGAIDNVEDVITELGVFGECEPIEGAPPPTTEAPPLDDPFGQVGGTDDLGLEGLEVPELDRDEDGCLPGEQFVGGFQFEGGALFVAFALGGLILVVAGSVANVVLAVLFNLMSDLTGGLRVTVLEEEPPGRDATRPTSSPAGRRPG